MKALLCLLGMLVLAGCSPLYIVNISSLSSENADQFKDYCLLPASGIDANDLQFQEYAAYIRRALGASGLTEAKPETASLAVFVTYGMGQPRTHVYGYSIPGQHARLASYDIYPKYLILKAYHCEKYRTEKVVEVWATTVTNTGCFADLRRVWPVMVGAAYPYIGKNTKQAEFVRLRESDPKVQFIKGLRDSP